MSARRIMNHGGGQRLGAGRRTGPAHERGRVAAARDTSRLEQEAGRAESTANTVDPVADK